MSRSHRVFAVVDNCQAKHQAIVIAALGIICGIMVIVLFDYGATDFFISDAGASWGSWLSCMFEGFG